MKRQDLFALAIALTIIGGLAIDSSGLPLAQALVSVASWVLFALLLRESDQKASLLRCLAFATAGEVVLSLVWGLYSYRLDNLPAFVPPGHVLLFWLGGWTAARLPERALRPLAWTATLATLAAALHGDHLSLALLALFLLCLRFGPSPRLYATMFGLALAMELWGTWLGNWSWHGTVPGLAIGAGNPPVAAGALYCALDFLVLVRWPLPRRLFGRASASR